MLMFLVPEQYRVVKGDLATDPSIGNNGVFIIPHPKIKDYVFAVLASDGMGWEHVSVHLQAKHRSVDRCPTWAEMCFVKDTFWSEGDPCVQFHPARKDYVNNHPTTLHLWRPTSQVLPVPPSYLVGFTDGLESEKS
jgi:hypothetical protein